MDASYGRPAKSVKRFSLLKWGVSGLLLAFVLLTWLAGNKPADKVPVPGAGGRISSADGGSPTPSSLALEIGADGAIKVQGVVTDEATRNQWLNEIRIGAQGARIVDELRVDKTSPAAASGWSGQLASLVASMRERRLEGLRVEGTSVLLRGVARSTSDKDESDKMILAQLPPGYRLESKIAIGAPVSGAPRPTTSASSSTPAKPQPVPPKQEPVPPKQENRPGGPADRSSASRSAGDQRAAEQKAAEQKAAEQKALADKQVADRNLGNRPSPDKLAQAGGQNPGSAGKGSPAAQTGCPSQLRSLAHPVYFKTDGASLSAEDRARLQRLGQCLGSSRVRVVGHADPRLGGEYNQGLSERRARVVAEALRAGGLPASRISVQGAGQGKPAPTASPEALQRSRRVDIEIR